MKKKIKDEMLKVHTELKTAIDFLGAASKPRHGSVVREVLSVRLPAMHRRTGRMLNLLNGRLRKDTTPNPNPQAPPVSRPVSPLLDPVSIREVDWPRLRSEIKKGEFSYGAIARAVGLGTSKRAAVHLVVNEKTKSGPVFNLVSQWAFVNGFSVQPKKKGSAR